MAQGQINSFPSYPKLELELQPAELQIYGKGEKP